MLIDLFTDTHKPHIHDKALEKEIHKVYNEMEITLIRFNEALDSSEIESIIFKMKELELHYSFLIKQAKLERISSSGKAGETWH